MWHGGTTHELPGYDVWESAALKILSVYIYMFFETHEIPAYQYGKYTLMNSHGSG